MNLDEHERLHRAEGAPPARAYRLSGREEKRVAEYERPLPEADAIFTMLAEDIRERGWQRLTRNHAEYGAALPWAKTHSRFRLRPSEMTLWAGPNGSWKSLTVGHILAHQAILGARVLIASLELTVEDQLARMATQLLGTDKPTRERYDGLLDALGDNLLVYDFVGRLRPERAVALARYACTELQVQHALIDNLTLVVPPGRDGDEASARFVAGLYQVGRDTGAHVHLICHVRKPDDDRRVMNRYDIRGTGAATDMVDNVVMLQTNEIKRAAGERGEAQPSDPDLWMTVDKQRHGGYRGRMGFWTHETSLQLIGSGIESAMVYG